MAAWSGLTGNVPNQWELKTLKAMDNAWLSASSGAASGKKHQAIGDYCNGAEVEKCRQMFGERLELTCSTCPE